MKISYKDIIVLNSILNKCVSSKEFSPDAMISLIDLKEELQKITEKHTKVFAEIMKTYSVVEKNGNYNWEGHAESTTISNKVNTIFASQLEVKNTNFLDAKQFVTMLPDGLTLNDLTFLGTFLRKKIKD